jgi:uncharacterized protein YodC (DUF2158 family)
MLSLFNMPKFDKVDKHAFETDLKCGDVVSLRSGGPLMTVEYVLTSKNASTALHMYPGIYCRWISDSGEPQSSRFTPEMLKVESPARTTALSF